MLLYHIQVVLFVLFSGKFAQTQNENYSAQKYIDIYTNVPNLTDFLSRKNYVKIQGRRVIDEENSADSNIQKISRNFDENSKQLEPKENFFSKINSVIRSQFSRLFKYGEKAEVPENKGKSSQNTPEKRFLNIFTVLQFGNSLCQAVSGTQTFDGTCYHRLECAQNGGVNMGACAKGYGVCCVFRNTCGGNTNQNITYFECNPNLFVPTTVPTTLAPPTVPSIDPRINYTSNYEEWGKQSTNANACILTVNKRVSDVRQLRIDFLDFDLRGPTNGNCVTDSLVITGGNTNMQIPIICGYNTGQHLYVDVSDVPGPVQLSVFVANPAEKKFRIKVSQIRAPCANFMNCLQYYTGVSGVVQSFNYDASPRGLGTPQYFNNLNYAICIKKEPGYCTISYSNVQNNVESPFRFVNVDSNGNMLIPPNQAGVEIFNCPDDYIVINGIRLCGDRLNDGSINADFRQNAVVTDYSGGPFVLPVRTNAQNVARGFKLYYQQNRCAT